MDPSYIPGYDRGFQEGLFDKQRLESVSEETRSQIMQRYNYAINHILASPTSEGYVDGFNSFREE